MNRARAFADHQHADNAEQRHVGQADDQIELVERPQPGEQRDTAGAADDAAGKQRQRQRDVDARCGANRQIAPENDEAATWVVTLATATAGCTPMKINSGVIRNPPPTPNMPEMNPTASPIASTRKTLTGMSAIGR